MVGWALGQEWNWPDPPRNRRLIGSVSHQYALYKCGEICSRTIFGRRRSARDVQAGVIERAERVVRVAGEMDEGQKQSGMVLETNGKKKH